MNLLNTRTTATSSFDKSASLLLNTLRHADVFISHIFQTKGRILEI